MLNGLKHPSKNLHLQGVQSLDQYLNGTILDGQES